MGAIALAGVTLLVTFLVTVVTRRGHGPTAWIVGSIPAALVAGANLPGLANPLVWAFILPILAAGVVGGFVGAWLARMVHAWWRTG